MHAWSHNNGFENCNTHNVHVQKLYITMITETLTNIGLAVCTFMCVLLQISETVHHFDIVPTIHYTILYIIIHQFGNNCIYMYIHRVLLLYACLP